MPALSKSEELGDTAKAAVEALGLTGATVVKRKTPGRPEGASSALPEIVVSVGEEGAVEKLDAETDAVKYPVAITIVTAGGAAAGDTQTAPANGTSGATVRDWRERVRKKMQAQATWAAVSGWNAVSTVGRPPFDPLALPKDLNFSTLVFTVETLESRT